MDKRRGKKSGGSSISKTLPNCKRRKKRRKPRSMTALCRKELKDRGWIAESVERKVPYTFISQDLFGFIDLLAMPTNGGVLLAIQATAGAAHSNRLAKCLAHPNLKLWLKTNNRFEVWSWSKRGLRGKRKLWTLRTTALELGRWGGMIKSREGEAD